jgi:hypothetical protein
MVKYGRYLELAQQAKTASAEVTMPFTHGATDLNDWAC